MANQASATVLLQLGNNVRSFTSIIQDACLDYNANFTVHEQYLTALCHWVHIVRATVSALAFVKTTFAKDLLGPEAILGAEAAAVEVAVKAAAVNILGLKKAYVLVPNTVPTEIITYILATL